MNITIDLQVESKICARCKCEKSISLFLKRKAAKDGLAQWCKDRSKEYLKEYYLENKEKLNIKNGEYRIQNKEKLKIQAKEYSKKNKEKFAKFFKNYYNKNKEELLEYKSEYYELKNGF